MSEEIRLAQIRLSNARQLAKQIGDDCRRTAVVLIAERTRWFSALDRVARLEREINEKITIEAAIQNRERRRAAGLKPDDDDEQPA